MSLAGLFVAPESVQSQAIALRLLTSIRTQILQAEFIRWPELAESFRRDEERLRAYMARMGWKPRKDAR